jgi:peptidoglycan/LPS O-acetylase OafA/YrhL
VLAISAGLFVQTFSNEVLDTQLAPTAWIVDMWHKYPLTSKDMLRESFLLDMPSLIVLLPQSWTLSIELVLSLLLPVGLLLVDRGTTWVVFFSLLAISLLGVSMFLLHFLLGLTIARYYFPITQYLSGKTWQRRSLLLTGLLFYTCASLLPKQLFGETITWLCSGLGAGMILMFVLGSSDAQTALSIPILRQIGKVSYSAYLSHMAILICLTPYILKALEAFTENRFTLWLGGWLLTIVAVQCLSLLFYHWLEMPSMTIGRRIADMFRD